MVTVRCSTISSTCAHAPVYARIGHRYIATTNRTTKLRIIDTKHALVLLHYTIEMQYES